jgi:uncharacterized membrane protein HdeD (DUF308 family)
MTAHEASPRVTTLTGRWWSLLIRGAAAIVFGILVMVVPPSPTSLLALVLLWCSYAFADGIICAVVATWARGDGVRCGWLAFEGLVSFAAGVFTILSCNVTAVALLTVIAAWAVSTGFLEVVGAIRLRRLMAGERALAATGILAFVVGVVLLVVAGPRALARPWLIELYALVFGALLISLGVGVHRWSRSAARSISA